MNQPGIVQTELGDESVLTRVDFGGEDALYVTPTRLVVYRGEGLLSDESVETYPHGAERISVSEGRRKSKLKLDYGLDGERTLSVPTSALEETLHPVVAGTLEASGRLDDDESVERTFRFSELTLVVTTDRLVKHVGAAVWDEDIEEFAFADVTDLTVEEGSVATSIVLTLNGRQERFKAPNDQARLVRESIRAALLSYHGATSLEELRAEAAERRADDDETDDPRPNTLDLGNGPEPLSANPRELSDDDLDGRPDDGRGPTESDGRAADANVEAEPAASVDPDSERDDSAPSVAASTVDDASGRDDGTDDGGADTTPGRAGGRSSGADAADAGAVDGDRDEGGTGTESGSGSGDAAGDGFESSGFQPAAGDAGATIPDEVAAELRDLRETVERQGERLERQSELVEQLIEELRQGR